MSAEGDRGTDVVLDGAAAAAPSPLKRTDTLKLKANVLTLDEQIATLQAAKAAAEKEAADYEAEKVRLAEEAEAAAKLKAEEEAAAAEAAKLKAEADAAKAAVPADNAAELAALEAELATKVAKLEKVETALHNTEIPLTADTLKSATDKKALFEKEITDLNAKIAELKPADPVAAAADAVSPETPNGSFVEVSPVGSDNGTLAAELAEALAKLKVVEDALAAANAELTAVRDANAKLTAENTTLAADLDRSEAALDLATKERADVVEANATLTAQSVKVKAAYKLMFSGVVGAVLGGADEAGCSVEDLTKVVDALGLVSHTGAEA